MRTACAFDWYTASVPVNPRRLVHDLKTALNADLDQLRPFPRYDAAVRLLRLADNQRAADLHWGRAYDEPLFQTSGLLAGNAVSALRAISPEHRVTRMDSALDVHDSAISISADVLPRLKKIAARRRMGTSLQGDWLRGLDGRTIYLGSRKSATFMRIYEKGPETGRPDLDWLRFEVQHRPHSTRKSDAATVSAASLQRSFPAGSELLSELGVPVPEADTVSLSQQAAAAGVSPALQALVRQYWTVIDDLLTRHEGQPERVVFDLLDARSELEKARFAHQWAARPERAETEARNLEKCLPQGAAP